MPKKTRQQLADEIGREMVKAMKKAGIRPEIIYAYEKCEFLVTATNRHLIDPEMMAEWEAAIDEYFELRSDDKISPSSQCRQRFANHWLLMVSAQALINAAKIVSALSIRMTIRLKILSLQKNFSIR